MIRSVWIPTKLIVGRGRCWCYNLDEYSETRGGYVVDKELFNKFVEWRRGVQTIGQDPVFYYKGKYILEVSNVDGLDTFIIIRTYNEELDTFETVSNKEYMRLLKDPYFKRIIM